MAGKDDKRASALIGKTIGGYRIRTLLGKGGMGEVYEGYDESLDRKVAVKVLRPALAADEEYTARFLREAKAAAKLEHPAICPMYTAGEENGIYFFAMQYVQGRTIRQYLKEYGSFPVQQALLVAQHAAGALGYAHSKKLVHRDIKPDNIMVDEEGRIKVMDFGLARTTGKKDAITQTGDYLGTPEYSSPEQCMTASIDGRSDLYSLGVVLYEMVTGNVPHSAETPLALFKKICEDPFEPVRDVNPGVPEKAAVIIERLLCKNPDERYESAEELAVAIEGALREIDEDFDADAETMALPLKKLSSSTPANLKPTPVTGGKREKNKTAVLVFSAALLIAVVLTALFLGKTESPGEQQPQVNVPEAAVLLVTDFRNSNSNPDIDWMSIAVADMSITDLSQCPFLTVISREKLNRTLKQHGMTRADMMASITEFTKIVSADMILKGSVAKLGSDIRIDIQLLSGSDGSIILSAGLTEPEETFFNAIDKLSVSLRTRIAQYLQSRYPGMQTAERGEDLSLEKQLFSTAALPESPQPAAKAADRALMSDEESESMLGAGAPPEPEKRLELRDAGTSADESDSVLREAAKPQRGIAAPESAPQGGTKGAVEPTEKKKTRNAVSRKPADAAERGRRTDVDRADKAPAAALKAQSEKKQVHYGRTGSHRSPRFAAIRAFYRACSLLEQEDENAKKEALVQLDIALTFNPAFEKAQKLKNELLSK